MVGGTAGGEDHVPGLPARRCAAATARSRRRAAAPAAGRTRPAARRCRPPFRCHARSCPALPWFAHPTRVSLRSLAHNSREANSFAQGVRSTTVRPRARVRARGRADEARHAGDAGRRAAGRARYGNGRPGVPGGRRVVGSALCAGPSPCRPWSVRPRRRRRAAQPRPPPRGRPRRSPSGWAGTGALPRSATCLMKTAMTGTRTAMKTAQKNTWPVAVAMPCSSAARTLAGSWASFAWVSPAALPPLVSRRHSDAGRCLAMSPVRAWLKIAPNSETPNEPPIDRKNVAARAGHARGPSAPRCSARSASWSASGSPCRSRAPPCNSETVSLVVSTSTVDSSASATVMITPPITG